MPTTGTIDRYEYYSCLCCGSRAVPQFHWRGDWLFEFHKMFMLEKQIQVLETSEVEFDLKAD